MNGSRGAARYNYLPIGTLRISSEGYLQRKVTDDHPVPVKRWVAVHRLVWEAKHGSIPRGHVVRFRPGKKTTEESEITIDKLELVSRAEHMRRNTINNYPPELKGAMQIRAALQRAIDSHEKRGTDSDLQHHQPARRPGWNDQVPARRRREDDRRQG